MEASLAPQQRRPVKKHPLQRLQDLIARHQDIGLVLLVVSVIVLMIIPLPYWVMDLLIAFNIGLSMLVLLAAIYTPEALQMSTFPSLLLFTTLLRLGLNIASTKLILLHAHAGQIIETFGMLVVGGDFIVGAVVFLIITVVQFIVIAKGSERVAEVGARFTLDAMPGKQMSIDADLRSGIISPDDARAKRVHLERESQLHGGMDGAMKFVKGDAIASLVISLISIGAGIAIGTLRLGMSFGEATKRYTILTVGDGLVSQIPALFIAISAGVLITRVSNPAQKDGNLGGEIGGQLIAQPKALIITAIILGACMLMPGFPKLQFLAVAVLMALPAFVVMRKKTVPASARATSVPAFARDGRLRDQPVLVDSKQPATSAPLMVVASPALVARVRPGAMNTAMMAARDRLHNELGIPFPGMRITEAARLQEGQYEVQAFDVPLASGTIGPDASSTESPEETLARHIETLVRENATTFIGMQETRVLLTRAELDYPEIVAEVVKTLPLQRMTEVFKRLVEEGIPVRDLRAILESLTIWGPREKDIVMLTEQVRASLARYITHRYAAGNKSLHAILLAPKIEEALRQTVSQSRGGGYVSISPDQAKYLCDQIQALMAKSEVPPVVLTRIEIRRFVKKVIEPYIPTIPVLSYEEIVPGAAVHTVGRVEA
jgi:type III secretion protein V